MNCRYRGDFLFSTILTYLWSSASRWETIWEIQFESAVNQLLTQETMYIRWAGQKKAGPGWSGRFFSAGSMELRKNL